MYRILPFGLLLALAACGAQPNEPPDEYSAPQDTLAVTPPDVRQDTIWIEGIPEPMDLRLYVPTADFPLAFYTYLPPDWRVEEFPTERTIVFSPAGPLARRAGLSVRIYPGGMTMEDALERLRVRASSDAQATGQTAVFLEQPEAPWALAEAMYTEGRMAGHATLTQHSDRFIEIVSQYPVEAGDGFAPREALILSEWRWADGQPLVPAGTFPAVGPPVEDVTALE